MADVQRRPHAALDTTGRYPKAAKIHHLLSHAADAPRSEQRLLEVGTGAGVIASYFAQLEHPRYLVEAVDAVDQRQLSDGYGFQTVAGTLLPFKAAEFDVVISNHVIEHVGNADAQHEHLSEIARVLKPGGVAYLAVPSRWQIVEPHYQLAWLSWLPSAWRSPYLRWRRGISHYDCRPLARGELEHMLATSGLVYRNLLPQALEVFVRQEGTRMPLACLAGCLPHRLVGWLAGLSPTHTYLLRHRFNP
jgi:SAM-dependent methyltransferase